MKEKINDLIEEFEMASISPFELIKKLKEINSYQNTSKLEKHLLKQSINRELDKLDYRLKQIEVYSGIPKDERFNYLGI